MTRARACVVRRSNVLECVCRPYDDANVLFYACWFARRQMPWSSLQGFVRTAGCTLRLALMRCELCCCCIFFISSVFFPRAVFIVRKFTVISIVPIQYCLAHLNKLISVI